MTARHTIHRIGVVIAALVVSIAIQTPSANAQDRLARAKDLYSSASYDEALAALEGLETNAPGEVATEVAQYRVFCLLALNRNDEAKKAIENLVGMDPFYRPSDTQVSPRIRTVIGDTRKALLPTIVQRTYADAKAAFDRKDPQASKQFERVLALLDDPDMQGGPATADLKTVATGFRDLSKAMAAPVVVPPPPAPAPAAAVTAPAAAAPEATGRPTASAAPAPASPPPAAPRAQAAQLVAPVTLSQRLPPWTPNNPADARLGFKGSIEITIDERGNVTDAVVLQSVHPLYDPELLEMARTWKYKPATKGGVPVSYQKVITVDLQPVVR